MSYPQPPDQQYSYTAAEQALGDGSLPGQELDTDLAAIRASVTATIEFLKSTMRSDGKLQNGIVTSDSLSAELRIGFNAPAPWATGRAYTTRDTAFSGFGFYLCTVAHTSGASFSVDLAAGRWTLLADLTPPTGTLLRANDLSDLNSVPTARTNLGLGNMALQTADAVSITGGTIALAAIPSITATTDEINKATNFGLIAQGTLSGTQLIVEIPSDFEAITVTVWNYQPTINSTTLNMAVGSGPIGTPVWGAAHYQQGMVIAGVSPGYYNASAATEFGISHLQSNTSSGYSEHVLNGFHVSGPVRGHGFRYGIDGSAVTRTTYESCGEIGAVVHSLIRLFVAAGTMAGTYRITGHRKP